MSGHDVELELCDRIEVLEKALGNLVAAIERWDAAVQTVVGRPANWDDGYLDEARAALKAVPYTWAKIRAKK